MSQKRVKKRAMKTAIQHCAERKASSYLVVGLVGFWERNGSLGEAFWSWDGASTRVAAAFVSVKAPLMQRWFLFYLPQKPEKTPSTSLVAITNFSKGHHVPVFPKDWWILLHSQCSHGSVLYPFAVSLFSGVRLISAMIMALFHPKTPVNTPWWQLIFCNSSKKGPRSSPYSPQ